MEFAFYGRRVLFDWYAELDSFTEFDVLQGTLVLGQNVGNELPFEIQQLEAAHSGWAESPGGTLQGVGVFRACDVKRFLGSAAGVY